MEVVKKKKAKAKRRLSIEDIQQLCNVPMEHIVDAMKKGGILEKKKGENIITDAYFKSGSCEYSKTRNIKKAIFRPKAWTEIMLLLVKAGHFDFNKMDDCEAHRIKLNMVRYFFNLTLKGFSKELNYLESNIVNYNNKTPNDWILLKSIREELGINMNWFLAHKGEMMLDEE